MHGIPQSIHLNPALRYRCKTYIELPVISSVRFAYDNTGFGYHDALHYGSGTQSDSILIDLDNLEKKLKKRNYIRNDLSVNILGAGLRIKDYYFHFNIADFTETRVGYPGDLIALKDGNWVSTTETAEDIDLGGLGATAFSYLQISLGASKLIDEYLSIGVRAKYLMGSASLVNRRSELDIKTQSDPLVLDIASHYKIYASFPMEISYDTSGIVTSVDFDNYLSNPISDYILNKNRGVAIDAGFIYEYTDQITLAASLINLGFIRWKSNVNRFETEGSFAFSGFNLLEYANNPDETQLIQSLTDSIIDSWEFRNSIKPYFTFLTTKLFVGASYQLHKLVTVSAVSRTDFYDRRPHPTLTLSAMFTPAKFFSTSLSYSMMNHKYNHLGFGFGLGGPGAQLYIVTDNIPIRYVKDSSTGIFWPYNARTINIRFGVNLLFNCKEEKRDRRKTLCPAYW